MVEYIKKNQDIFKGKGTPLCIRNLERQRKRQTESHERTGNRGEAENVSGCELSKSFVACRDLAVV